jgi:TRAP-type C4-dicarboxylate transport system permease small subunit
VLAPHPESEHREEIMVNLVARVLVALATAAMASYGTSFVSAAWRAGPGHAAEAVGALIVCLVLCAAAILLAIDVALDVLDAHRLRTQLAERRHVLDRLSVIG